MKTNWFVFYSDSLSLTTDNKIPFASCAPVVLDSRSAVHRLPDMGGYACRAVSLERPVDVEGFHFVTLRDSFDLLPLHVYQMAGKARELIYWDSCTKFCGTCGASMIMHTDISKRCSNCGKEIWPQLSAAIIVAVTRGADEILLVQSNKFKADYLGLVAGFVETGETLEECVHREVMEETHLRIKNLTYFNSQPWPYPCGLMIGFKAEYDGGTLQLQRSELNKGGWYRRDNMPAIPGKVSLARQLIDDWLKG